jgi:hypothetical protein
MDSVEDILGFKLYNNEFRNRVIKFCGWTDYQRLSPQIG